MRTLRPLAWLAAIVVAGCNCLNPVGPADGTVRLIGLTVTGQTSLAIGGTVTLSATAAYSDGSRRDVTSVATWASSDSQVCNTGTTPGLMTGVAAGTCTALTAFEQMSGGLPLTVSGAASSGSGSTPPGSTPPGSTPPGSNPPSGSGAATLHVTGTSSLAVGQTSQWTATYTVDGAPSNVTTQAAWSSDMPSTASVSATGLVTAVAPGTTTIRAFHAGISAAATVVVTGSGGGGPPPTVTSLSITGTPCSTVGTSAQLQAVASMSNGSSQNVTTAASWSSGNGSVATVSAGLVSCAGAGSTQVSAQYGGHTASIPVTVSGGGGGGSQATLIGIEITIDASPIANGGTMNLILAQLLSDPQLQARVFALYSDDSRQEVTNATVLSTDTPLLTVNSAGVINASSVLAQALVDPTHVVNAQYGGFTINVSLAIAAPVLSTLPIQSLQLPGIASLSAGTKLPNVTAIVTNGFGGTTSLVVPAGNAGLSWEVTPRNYVPILGPIVGATVNAALAPLGNLVGDVVIISGDTVQSINVGPIGGVVSLLGGVLQVDTRAVVGSVTSNSVATQVLLGS